MTRNEPHCTRDYPKGELKDYPDPPKETKLEETKLETMNLAPSWEATVKMCMLTLETVEDEGAKRIARQEIIRLAQAVDKEQEKENES